MGRDGVNFTNVLQTLVNQLRGKDLNLRPLGYEPNELPLLHPAV